MKSERTKARDKADKHFSYYVRQRDADDNGIIRCCTCGKFHLWKYLDCGHFMPREFDSTRFDEENTGPQCKYCNGRKQGEQFKFGIYLDNKYGKGTAEKMTTKSRMFSKRNRYDFECIAAEYKNKLKRL